MPIIEVEQLEDKIKHYKDVIISQRDTVHAAWDEIFDLRDKIQTLYRIIFLLLVFLLCTVIVNIAIISF